MIRTSREGYDCATTRIVLTGKSERPNNNVRLSINDSSDASSLEPSALPAGAGSLIVWDRAVAAIHLEMAVGS
jgi:hypothetical protein